MYQNEILSQEISENHNTCVLVRKACFFKKNITELVYILLQILNCKQFFIVIVQIFLLNSIEDFSPLCVENLLQLNGIFY